MGRVLRWVMPAMLAMLGVRAETWRLVTVDRVTDPSGGEVLRVARSSISGASPESAGFRVVVAEGAWPSGLVPVFAVGASNGICLRRRPEVGQEGVSEPLFFALPPEGEAEVTRVAGSWKARFGHPDGRDRRLRLDLAVEGGQVSARFDPGSDYRFATLDPGTWRSNRVCLPVAYLGERYLLEAEWRGGRWLGTWMQQPPGDRGTWVAEPDTPVAVPADVGTRSLRVWSRPDGARRYRCEGEDPGPGWERARAPLCRVWVP